MNVLSLFDGISAGQVALQRSGIKVDNYYSSEIDKYAIKITQKNFPNTIQLGDVTKWRGWHLSNIDMIVGGSPCQGFSFAGKQLNFEDSRSKLFFEFVDIVNFYKPKYFLLENVKMKKEYQDVISSYLGVEPIEINSALVSAQNRKRLYWTNIPNITQPGDRGIILKDILEYGVVDDRMVKDNKAYCLTARYGGAVAWNSIERKQRTMIIDDVNVGSIVGRRINEDGVRKDYDKNVPLTQCLQVKEDNLKTGCLTTVNKDNVVTDAPSGRYKDIYKLGNINPSEKGINSNTYSVDSNKMTTLTTNKGEGSNVGLIQVGVADNINGHDQIKRIYSEEGKCPTLTTMQGGHREPKIAVDQIRWRKLTPIECERLQTFDDNYTEGISNSQRYKALGNSWTVEVIVHIFKNMI